MISPVFSYGRSSPKAGRHWMTDFFGKRPTETRVSRSDSEHLLATHPSSRVWFRSYTLALAQFVWSYPEINRALHAHTLTKMLSGFGKQGRARSFRSQMARTDLNSKRRMVAGGIKT